MKHLLFILLTLTWFSSLQAQTIKTLGFNSTNGQVVANTGTNVLTFTNSLVLFGTELTISNNILTGPANSLSFEDGAFSGSLYMDGGNIQFSSATNAAITRTNLGLPLPALTNTSNVTMMRALAGSTNTNEPHSGVIELSDGTSSFELTFSNGILLKIIGPL